MKGTPVSNSTFVNGGTSYTCIDFDKDDTPINKNRYQPLTAPEIKFIAYR